MITNSATVSGTSTQKSIDRLAIERIVRELVSEKLATAPAGENEHGQCGPLKRGWPKRAETVHQSNAILKTWPRRAAALGTRMLYRAR